MLPRPRGGEGREGTLTLRSPLRVRCDDAWREDLEVFATDLAGAVGWTVRRVDDGEDCDIDARRDGGCGSEGYRVRVGERIDIAAGDAAGFSYALTALRQLGPAQLWSRTPSELATWTLDALDLVDAPSFAWRGVHLDVARHFFDVAAVRRLIDLLAAHRLNHLHLHLNDDQGWRVEVPAWPGLTTVGAWRSGSPVGHEHDDVRDDVAHGGFYNAADVAELVEHARRRHVRLIPEIDLPGHAQSLLAAYPQFGNTGAPLEVWTHWGISHHVLNVEAATLEFADEVVRYVAGLFPDSPVHIGGDECPSVQWERSAAARDVMDQRGFDDPRQLQGLFTERLTRSLLAEGRAVLAWDEVLDAEVIPGTTICAWRSARKGVEAAERGFDVIMAPMQHLYFDWLSSDGPEEPVAVAPWPYVTTWEKVYGVAVIPEGLHPAHHHHVRGAQAQLWTEYIDSVARLDYMAFPRLCAFSEVVWGTGGDVEEFRPRLEHHLRRLDAMGVAYRALDPARDR
ncbi:MAG: beta-N-acetylhexosaminidase [Acidobacteria bacterium]|nr:beta-N-acetylhexosaminidase [Acidobacteriota bacterium]